MSAEHQLGIKPGPHFDEYTSVIHDQLEDKPIAVALKEDFSAFAEDFDLHKGTAASGMLLNFFGNMKFTRKGVGRLQTDNFAFGAVIQTRRAVVRNQNNAFGLRLDCMGTVLELIDSQARGESPKLHRFGPESAKFFHRYAEAVLL